MGGRRPTTVTWPSEALAGERRMDTAGVLTEGRGDEQEDSEQGDQDSHRWLVLAGFGFGRNF